MSEIAAATTTAVKHKLAQLREEAQLESLEAQADKINAEDLIAAAQAEIQAYDLAVESHQIRDLVEDFRQAAVVRIEENQRRIAEAEQKKINADKKTEAFLDAYSKL